MGLTRKLVDWVARRLGYTRADGVITGHVKISAHDHPFVNLTIPGGQRISGWVDNRLPLANWVNFHGD